MDEEILARIKELDSRIKYARKKEYYRAYYKKNREKIKAVQKKYREGVKKIRHENKGVNIDMQK
jgi:hypothetical protein